MSAQFRAVGGTPPETEEATVFATMLVASATMESSAVFVPVAVVAAVVVSVVVKAAVVVAGVAAETSPSSLPRLPHAQDDADSADAEGGEEGEDEGDVEGDRTFGVPTSTSTLRSGGFEPEPATSSALSVDGAAGCCPRVEAGGVAA